MKIIKDNLASPVRSSAALERKKFVSVLDIYLWSYLCTFVQFILKYSKEEYVRKKIEKKRELTKDDCWSNLF